MRSLYEGYPDASPRPIRFVVVAEELDQMVLFVCYMLVTHLGNNEWKTYG